MAMQGKYSMAHNHNYVQRRATIEGGACKAKTVPSAQPWQVKWHKQTHPSYEVSLEQHAPCSAREYLVGSEITNSPSQLSQNMSHISNNPFTVDQHC